MTPTKQLLWITALVTVLAIPGFANAQTCASNSDCAQGLTCQASTATPTPTPACSPGAACLPTTTPPATSLTCLPAPCQTDTDCGQAMVCHSETTTTCSGGTAVAVKCAPNTVCTTTPPATDPVCTDTTTSQCVYKWQLACNADADCGTGFVCQPTTMGMCSGSGPVSGGSSSSSGTGGGSGSGALPAPPLLPVADAGTSVPVCVTTTSFPGSCQVEVASCTVDSDCPSIWKCVDSNPPTAVSNGPIAVDAGAAPTPLPPGTTGTAVGTATTTSTAAAAKTCQSPNWYPRSTGGNGNPQTTIDIGSAPDAGATTKGTTTPPTTVAPGPSTSTGTQTTAKVTGGGCALGAGALPGSPAMFVGLLGALGLLRLRHRRS
jgi:hypothetical protein